MRHDLISTRADAQKMGERKMSGAQILDHFAKRLPSVEASLPSLLQVQRLSRAPSDAAELDSLRSTYEGEPVVFPASWVPSWTDALRTSSVLEGLKRLLSGIVQVDAFQLQYEACKDQECKVTFQKGTCDVSSFHSCEQSSTTDDPSKSLCILQLLREREDTHNFNSNKFFNGGLYRYINNDKQHDNNSIVGNPFNRNLTATDNMCVETNTVTRLYHPIASSSSEVIDFGDFISKMKSALLHPRDQLWYLTWRGIPASEKLESSLVPTEFDFFIRSLLHPTTSPDFIAEDAIVQRNLWVGAIVTSRIHFDALDNVHVCISGKKLFHLYPPSALLYLYPKPWREGALNNFSLMESILLANRTQHANFFQNVKCWHAEVKAGEAIFIPAGWWHEVFTFEETVSANVWFKPNQVTRFRATLMHLKSENYYKFMLQRTEREPHI